MHAADRVRMRRAAESLNLIQPAEEILFRHFAQQIEVGRSLASRPTAKALRSWRGGWPTELDERITISIGHGVCDEGGVPLRGWVMKGGLFCSSIFAVQSTGSIRISPGSSLA